MKRLSDERWSYYADALPEYAHKLVRIDVGDGMAQRYTARHGWVDANGIQSEVKWTGDWDSFGLTTLTPSSRILTTRNPVSGSTIGVRRGN